MRFPLRVVALALALALPVVADEGKPGDGEKKSATKDDYVLDTTGTTSTVKLKGDGVFSIVVRPAPGLKINPQAPLEVKLKASDGLKPQKVKLGRTDVVDAKAAAPELRTAIRAEGAGPQEIEASVSFFLCTDAWCQRMTDKITVAVKVE